MSGVDMWKGPCRLYARRIARFESNRVESSTFATLPNVNNLLAVFFLSLSQIDFRWVESSTNLDESTQFGCIGQPSLKEARKSISNFDKEIMRSSVPHFSDLSKNYQHELFGLRADKIKAVFHNS